MKTSELIKALKNMGYDCSFGEKDDIIVKTKNGENWFSIDGYNSTRPGFSTFPYKYISVGKFNLLDIIMEFCKSTQSERTIKNEKFRLRLPAAFNQDIGYLNYALNGSQYLFSTNHEVGTVKTSFTQQEIDAMPFDTSFLVREEV